MEENGQPEKHDKAIFDMGSVAVTTSDQTETGITHHEDVVPEDLVEPGETLVMTVKRHMIGLILYYLAAGAGVLALIMLIMITVPGLGGDRSVYAVAIAGGLLLLFIAVGILLVLTYIYHKSEMLITDKSLIQVLQKSLFSQKISRLSMSNVEDVNAERKGFLQTMINYGTLTIQTAGEQDNFVFPYCPNPSKYADIILEQRQAYAHSRDELLRKET